VHIESAYQFRVNLEICSFFSGAKLSSPSRLDADIGGIHFITSAYRRSLLSARKYQPYLHSIELEQLLVHLFMPAADKSAYKHNKNFINPLEHTKPRCSRVLFGCCKLEVCCEQHASSSEAERKLES